MTTKQIPGFAGACRDFFGMLPGQTLKDFMGEMKALSPKDREEIAEGLKANGIEFRPETVNAQ